MVHSSDNKTALFNQEPDYLQVKEMTCAFDLQPPRLNFYIFVFLALCQRRERGRTITPCTVPCNVLQYATVLVGGWRGKRKVVKREKAVCECFFTVCTSNQHVWTHCAGLLQRSSSLLPGGKACLSPVGLNQWLSDKAPPPLNDQHQDWEAELIRKNKTTASQKKNKPIQRRSRIARFFSEGPPTNVFRLWFPVDTTPDRVCVLRSLAPHRHHIIWPNKIIKAASNMRATIKDTRFGWWWWPSDAIRARTLAVPPPKNKTQSIRGITKA